MQAIITILLALLITFPTAAFVPESQEPIRIILNNWTSQIVLSKITGTLLERMGYRVAYATVTVDDQWGALRLGLEHVQVEVWEGTMSMESNRFLQKGLLTEAGDHAALTREDWWYPAYVEEMCPGLPDWRALKRCASLFATDETAPSGRFLAGPWEKPERARIRALGLDFKVVEVGHADALWAELKEAMRKKTPILLFNWTPNWVEARHKGRFVEFPAYAPECETDPAWGVNPDFHQDCGNPKNAWLKKMVWPGMEKRWPCAYALLRNISFTGPMIAEAAAWVDADGMTPGAAAARWLTTRRSVWESWIPACARSQND